jgi:hypothetical protein
MFHLLNHLCGVVVVVVSLLEIFSFDSRAAMNPAFYRTEGSLDLFKNFGKLWEVRLS